MEISGLSAQDDSDSQGQAGKKRTVLMTTYRLQSFWK